MLLEQDMFYLCNHGAGLEPISRHTELDAEQPRIAC